MKSFKPVLDTLYDGGLTLCLPARSLLTSVALGVGGWRRQACPPKPCVGGRDLSSVVPQSETQEDAECGSVAPEYEEQPFPYFKRPTERASKN
jgi:hypothetical protein